MGGGGGGGGGAETAAAVFLLLDESTRKEELSRDALYRYPYAAFVVLLVPLPVVSILVRAFLCADIDTRAGGG